MEGHPFLNLTFCVPKMFGMCIYVRRVAGGQGRAPGVQREDTEALQESVSASMWNEKEITQGCVFLRAELLEGDDERLEYEDKTQSALQKSNSALMFGLREKLNQVCASARRVAGGQGQAPEVRGEDTKCAAEEHCQGVGVDQAAAEGPAGAEVMGDLFVSGFAGNGVIFPSLSPVELFNAYSRCM